MSEVITSGKVIKKPEVVVDPTDFLPPGVIDMRTKTREEAGTPDGLAVDISDREEELIVIENQDDPGDTRAVLPVPQDMKIVSQIIKIGRDKKVTVDVLIETSDLTGVSSFEVRLTKLPSPPPA